MKKNRLVDEFPDLLKLEKLPYVIKKAKIMSCFVHDDKGEYHAPDEYAPNVIIKKHDSHKCYLVYSPNKPISRLF